MSSAGAGRAGRPARGVSQDSAAGLVARGGEGGSYHGAERVSEKAGKTAGPRARQDTGQQADRGARQSPSHNWQQHSTHGQGQGQQGMAPTSFGGERMA